MVVCEEDTYLDLFMTFLQFDVEPVHALDELAALLLLILDPLFRRGDGNFQIASFISRLIWLIVDEESRIDEIRRLTRLRLRRIECLLERIEFGVQNDVLVVAGVLAQDLAPDGVQAAEEL